MEYWGCVLTKNTNKQTHYSGKEYSPITCGVKWWRCILAWFIYLPSQCACCLPASTVPPGGHRKHWNSLKQAKGSNAVSVIGTKHSINFLHNINGLLWPQRKNTGRDKTVFHLLPHCTLHLCSADCQEWAYLKITIHCCIKAQKYKIYSSSLEESILVKEVKINLT